MTLIALNDAIKSKSLNQVNDLLGHNSLLLCKMDRWGYYPIHYAVGTSLDMTELLLHYKANVNVRSKHKHLPIYYAAKNNQLSTLNLLIEISTTSNLVDLIKSFNIALEKRNTEALPLIMKEISSRDNLYDKIDGFLMESLNKALKYKYIEGVKMLLIMKADPNVICDALGNTPLHVAAIINDKKLISELLRCGAKKNMQNVLGKTYLDILSNTNQPASDPQNETWDVELMSEGASFS